MFSFSVFLAAFCVSLAVLDTHLVSGSAVHNSECKDRVTFLCARHLRQGHCEQDRYSRFLKNICKKSCNFCADEECADVNRFLCEEKQKQGDCQEPTPYTLNMCKKTCGFCDDVRK